MIIKTLIIGLNNPKQNNHMIKLYFSSETKNLVLPEELNAKKLKKGSITAGEPFFMLNLLSIQKKRAL